MVLVIIGLLVSAVIAGQDLIQAAQVRSTSAQYREFIAAINTFDLKFRSVPGDMGPQKVNQFGLHLPGNPCAPPFNQPGCQAPYPGIWPGSPAQLSFFTDSGRVEEWPLTMEGANFFMHLSQAKLIKGDFNPLAWQTSGFTEASLAFPVPKIGSGTYWPYDCSITGGSNRGCFLIGVNPNTIQQGGAAILTSGLNLLKAEEAYQLDQKLDDGVPGRGSVRVTVNYLLRSGDGETGNIDIDFTFPASANCCSGGACSAASDYNVAIKNLYCTIELDW